jgi:hypothetical protein
MYKQRSTKHYTENEKHELHYLSLGWAQALRNKSKTNDSTFNTLFTQDTTHIIVLQEAIA